MRRSRKALTLGAGVAILAVGSTTATAAATGTCRQPTFFKTYASTTASWNTGIEGQAPFTWSFRPTVRIVDGCTKGWIRVAPGVVTPVIRHGRRVESKIEFLSTKRAGWTALSRVRTPVRPITYGLGRPGVRGPFKAGERITKVRVTTTLWTLDENRSPVRASTSAKTYVVPSPTRKKVTPKKAAPKKTVTPKKTAKPKPKKTNPAGTISLPAAPALPSAGAG